MALPITRPGQEFGSGDAWELMIEEYGGEVEGTLERKSIMRQFIAIKSVQGTDTITNDRVGEATLQAVTPGVAPDPHVTEFSNVNVVVDTIVLARNTVALLDDFQAHFSVRSEIGKEHGKKIAKFFDEAFLIQAIKTALHDGTGLPSGWTGGIKKELGMIGDESDADALQRGIEEVCQAMEEADQDLEGAVIFVRPEQFYTLLRNDKLLNSEYSLGNGDYAKGDVLRSCGLPLFKTNNIPDAPVTNHFLSNPRNGAAYDLVLGDETNVVAIVMLPKALLAGETIPLTSKVFYEDKELTWFIDSYLAFGVTTNRPDACGVVLRKTA